MLLVLILAVGMDDFLHLARVQREAVAAVEPTGDVVGTRWGAARGDDLPIRDRRVAEAASLGRSDFWRAGERSIRLRRDHADPRQG